MSPTQWSWGGTSSRWIRRFLFFSVAWVALGLGGSLASGMHGQDGDSCTLCSDSQTIACMTCKGTRVAQIPCRSCRGEGRADCAQCEDGKIDCLVGVCRDGKVTWRSGIGFQRNSDKKADQDPCKFCRKRGTLKCKACTSGVRKCVTCRSKGTVKAACWDCVGSGQLPCPLCAAAPDPEVCPWSGSAREVPCKACISTPKPRNCWTCGGKGVALCETCRGHRQKPCGPCGSTGKVRYAAPIFEGGSKGGVRKHEDCGGKGVVDCDDCKKGLQACKDCTEGKVESCVLCTGSKQAPCRACETEPYRPFEAYGMFLKDEGRSAEAGEYLESARTVAQRYFRARVTRIHAEQAQWGTHLEGIRSRNAKLADLGLSTPLPSPRVPFEQRLRQAKQEAAKVSKRLEAAQASLR